MPKNIHNTLRMLRHHYEIQQTEMAEQAGFTNSFVSEVETGRRSVSLATIQAYARVFGVPVWTVILFDELMETLSVNRSEAETLADSLPDPLRSLFRFKALLEEREWHEALSAE